MGSISKNAKLILDEIAIQSGASNKGRSGVMPMVEEHKEKKELNKYIRSIGGENGIHDEENDWLSRQLKEEAAALKRMEEEYGLKHFSSDAQKLKAEHAIEHAYERYNGTRR